MKRSDTVAAQGGLKMCGARKARYLPVVLVAILVFMVTGLARLTEATVLQVIPTGAGSWPTIQDAIDAAASGDTIQLAAGTFVGDGNRDLDTNGKSLMICSATDDPSTCVINCGGFEWTPHRAFHFHSGEDSTTVVRGIGIVDGYAIESGGAVLCVGADDGGVTAPLFMNCHLRWNEGPDGAAIGTGAGDEEVAGISMVDCEVSNNYGSPAIKLTGQFSPCRLDGCQFRANGAGGLYLLRSTLRARACVFMDNGGWAIKMESDGWASISSCEFVGNAGAAAFNSETALPVLIEDCRVTENLSALHFSADYGLQVVGTEIIDNYSSGIAIQWGVLELRSSRICGNLGEGIAIGFPIIYSSIDSCLVSGNEGDGILLYSDLSYSTVAVENSTIVQNGGTGLRVTASSEGAPGGVRVAGCTISGNGGGGLVHQPLHPVTLAIENCLVTFNLGASVVCGPEGTPQLSCCDLFGNAEDWPACIADQTDLEGNMCADPLYCDASGMNYGLDAESPAAEAAGGACGQIGALPVGCIRWPTEVTRDDPPVALPALFCSPNPFNPRLDIRCRVVAAGEGEVTVFDLAGRTVARIYEGLLTVGEHRFRWNGIDGRGRSVAGGVYLVRLRGGGGTTIQKVALMR